MEAVSHALAARRVWSAAALERSAYLVIALAALGSCLLVYAFGRSAPPALVPRLGGWDFPTDSTALARVVGSYPSFAHVVGMSFLSAGILRWGRGGAVRWGVFWMGVNAAWEALSLEGPVGTRAMQVAASVAGEGWRSTADVFDVVAAAFGLGMVAALASGVRAGVAWKHRDAAWRLL